MKVFLDESVFAIWMKVYLTAIQALTDLIGAFDLVSREAMFSGPRNMEGRGDLHSTSRRMMRGSATPFFKGRENKETLQPTECLRPKMVSQPERTAIAHRELGHQLWTRAGISLPVSRQISRRAAISRPQQLAGNVLWIG